MYPSIMRRPCQILPTRTQYYRPQRPCLFIRFDLACLHPNAFFVLPYFRLAAEADADGACAGGVGGQVVAAEFVGVLEDLSDREVVGGGGVDLDGGGAGGGEDLGGGGG